MKSVSSFSYLFFFTFIFFTLSFHTCYAQTYVGCFSKIYAFGDSLTDTGNTNSSKDLKTFAHVSDHPYGMTYFHHPTNRFSDGRIVIDFVAQTLGLPLLPPYRNKRANFSHGVNFAVAGGTAINYNFYKAHHVVAKLLLNDARESLTTEMHWFDEFVRNQECKGKSKAECKKIMGNALFWVGEIGANDYARIFGSNLKPEHVRKLAIKAIMRLLKNIVYRGGKYIVVQGMPPTGCMSSSMSMFNQLPKDVAGCIALPNQNSARHDKLLLKNLNIFRARHPEAVIIYADFFGAFVHIVKNAARYGFTYPFRACCGYKLAPYSFDVKHTCGFPGAEHACQDPSKCINWDGVHLTEAMCRTVTNLFFNGSYFKPPFEVIVRAKNCSSSSRLLESLLA